MMKIISVSNNPIIINKKMPQVQVINGGFLDVLEKAKDKILKGYKLVTHPLTGSISPQVMPYKSIILESGPGQVDDESLQIINLAIAYARSLIQLDPRLCWDEASLTDFQLIDFDFVKDMIAMLHPSKI